MQKRSLGYLILGIAMLISLFWNCASQESLSEGGIDEENFEQIAALALAVSRLPEEAALAGYLTAHEDRTESCLIGSKEIRSLRSERLLISYNECGFDTITWNGDLEQPAQEVLGPYTIFFGSEDRDFGFYQTDATFFAPFLEEIGFYFKGDLTIEHVDQADLFSGSVLDVRFTSDILDDLYTFRDMRVNRSYDSASKLYGFFITVEISGDLMPTTDCEVTARFKRLEDQYPFEGEMRITSLNDRSKLDVQVVENGAFLILKLDNDNDDVYEHEQLLSWEEIKEILPDAYQPLFSYFWHS